MIQKIFHKVYRTIFPDFIEHLMCEISANDVVLDLGCGKNSPLQLCKFREAVGIDGFKK